MQASWNLHVDAYLLWAIRTGFRYYHADDQGKCTLLVKFSGRLDDDMRQRLGRRAMVIPQIYQGSRCVTLSVPVALVADALEALNAEGALLAELGTPLAPAQLVQPRIHQLEDAAPDIVIGVIDDGCPFAHQALRPGQPHGLAVRYVWDQGGRGHNPGAFGGGTIGGYGAEYLAAQLDAALQAGTTKAGTLDEDRVYAATALPSLREASSHGAHVLSHLVDGARPAQGGLAAQPAVAGSAQIAFVQLPPAALDDPSGAWLNHYGMDAIGTIVTYARRCFVKGAAQTVIVNLSYGPQTGPHDGRSVMEQAMDELAAQAEEENYALRIVLPAGNNHLGQAHAQFDLERIRSEPPGPSRGCVEWRVSADSQLPSLLELWLPEGVGLDRVEIRLRAPTGEIFQASAPMPWQQAQLQQLRQSLQDQWTITAADEMAMVLSAGATSEQPRIQVLMALAPTARRSDLAAPPLHRLAVPGLWRVQVRPLAASGTFDSPIVHAYLGRSDANMGRARRGHSGRLLSPGYDPRRFMREDEQLEPDHPNGPSEVVARHSLSGIATGSSTWVAAGYRLSDRLPVPYSSSGPALDTSVCDPSPRWAYPCDESRVHGGLLSGGNRSATVLRLSGTSTAAPQMARELAGTPGHTFPVAVAAQPPVPLPAWFRDRFGHGTRRWRAVP